MINNIILVELTLLTQTSMDVLYGATTLLSLIILQKLMIMAMGHMLLVYYNLIVTEFYYMFV